MHFSLLRRHPSVLVLLILGVAGCPPAPSGGGYGDDDDDATTANDDDDDDDSTPSGPCGGDTCEDDQFCRAETCEDIFGRSFQFTIHSAVIDETGPDGAWDPFGGLPDPYAEITWNGDLIVDTDVIDDTLSPTWGDSGTQVLSSGGELCLSVFDSNWPLASDSIDGSCWEGNDGVVAWVRLGSYDPELFNGYAQLSVTIEPNF